MLAFASCVRDVGMLTLAALMRPTVTMVPERATVLRVPSVSFAVLKLQGDGSLQLQSLFHGDGRTVQLPDGNADEMRVDRVLHAA